MITYITSFFAWAALAFYFGCFIPQIVENYRIKSTKGLSPLAMLIYFVAYLSLLYYIFLLDLMLPYKVFVPLESAALIVLIAQRFYYQGLYSSKLFFWGFIGVVLGSIICFPLAMLYPTSFGGLCGWISLVTFVSQPIPQVIKIYQEQSVEGFSFGFVTLQAIAVGCEFTVAMLFHLPAQTVLMVVKGFVFYLIYCHQFWLYGKKLKYKKTIEEFIAPCLLAQQGKDSNSINFPISLKKRDGIDL